MKKSEAKDRGEKEIGLCTVDEKTKFRCPFCRSDDTTIEIYFEYIGEFENFISRSGAEFDAGIASFNLECTHCKKRYVYNGSHQDLSFDFIEEQLLTAEDLKRIENSRARISGS